MNFIAGVDNNSEGRSIAWALEHPGCFAYGMSADAALSNLKGALDKYAGWILHHEPRTWLTFSPDEIELIVNGIWDVYFINDSYDKVDEATGYNVDSFFPHDWKPLEAVEIERGLKLLAWSRTDLLKTVQGLSTEKLEATYMGERWSINGILGHVAGAEWWYLDRLGLAFPKNNLPEGPVQKLEKVRTHLIASLPKLEGVRQVLGIDGEFWSPRKLLRRTLWHERDHTAHILKLI